MPRHLFDGEVRRAPGGGSSCGVGGLHLHAIGALRHLAGEDLWGNGNYPSSGLLIGLSVEREVVPELAGLRIRDSDVCLYPCGGRSYEQRFVNFEVRDQNFAGRRRAKLCVWPFVAV